MIPPLLHIFPSPLLNRLAIAVQFSTLNFRRSIGLDQVLIFYHTKTNVGFLIRLPFEFNRWTSLRDYRRRGMSSTFSEVCHHIPI